MQGQTPHEDPPLRDLDRSTRHGEPPRARRRWRRAVDFIANYRGALALVIVLTLLFGAAGAVEPLLMKRIFDGLTTTPDVRALVITLASLLGLSLAREIVGAANNWLTWRTRLGVQYDLLSATVGKLHALPLSYHAAGSVGATMTKLDRGVQGVANGLWEVTCNVLPAVIYLAAATVLMWRLDWRATLVVLAFVPLPAIIGAIAAPEQTRRERSLLTRWMKIYSRFNEVLGGILTVKTFAMEEAEKQRFLSGVAEANRLVARGVRTDSAVTAVKDAVVALARLAALVAGAVFVVRGSMTVGTVIAFMAYVGGMFGPVQGLVGIYQTLQRTSVALDTVLSILDAQDSLGDAPNAKALTQVRGDVAFEDVCFSYDGKAQVLHGIDLHARPGECIALVGPSGSGKTTMMALLQRLYDPTRGVVRVDGHDLRTLKQRSLRRQIGVVLQDSLLFNDSIRSNITYGTPEASERAIARAAAAAHAHEFIMRLPDGYDTIVGERGSRLSAGQRQRIVIARALLKDPRILILDEATSALDAESEALVQQALVELWRGRTTFIIAHRLSTVTAADRVLVIQAGRIVETGTHGHLLAAGGLYATMVRRQASGLRLTEPSEA